MKYRILLNQRFRKNYSGIIQSERYQADGADALILTTLIPFEIERPLRAKEFNPILAASIPIRATSFNCNPVTSRRCAPIQLPLENIIVYEHPL